MPLDAAPDRLREVLAPLQGLALTPETWERDVLPRRLGSYDRTWLDRLCAAGEVVWTGAGSGAGRGGRVALYFREDAPFLGPPQELPEHGPRGRAHDALRERLDGRRRLLVGPAGRPRRVAGRAARRAVGPGVGRRGDQRRLRAAARAAPVARAAGARRAVRRRRFGSRRTGAQPQLQGRWSLARRLFEPRPTEKERAQARAELLLERHGLVARETVVGERVPGRVRERVRGAGGARDARLRAARLLRRGPRRRPVRAVGGGRAAAHAPRRLPARRSCSPRRTRPTSTARCCPGRGATEQARRPARVPGRLRGAARRSRGPLCRGRRPRAGVARGPPGGVAAGGARRAGRVRALRAGRCGASRSSAGTASPCSARRSRSCWWSGAFGRARAA